jgi:5'-methylthioadenosine phosphorylase
MKLGVIISSVMDIHQFATIDSDTFIQTNGKTVKTYNGRVNGKEITFINRSSVTNDPPHMVDYRANIEALKKSGVTHIISSCVTGSLNEEIREGHLVLLDQFLDFTKRSQFSRFEQGDFAFMDITDPYSDALRKLFLKSSEDLAVPIHPTGCYVGVDGPRFETRAEIKMYRLLGGDVIGMTNVQETIMAREYGISISSLAYVSNMGAGMEDKFVTRAGNAASVNNNAHKLQALFNAVINRFTSLSELENDNFPEIEIIKHKRL